MLILSRKRSETIRIGDDICITVIRTGRNSVKIGIEAPDHVHVLRAELCRNGGSGAKENVFREGDSADSEHVAVCSDQFPHPHIG